MGTPVVYVGVIVCSKEHLLCILQLLLLETSGDLQTMRLAGGGAQSEKGCSNIAYSSGLNVRETGGRPVLFPPPPPTLPGGGAERPTIILAQMLVLKRLSFRFWSNCNRHNASQPRPARQKATRPQGVGLPPAPPGKPVTRGDTSQRWAAETGRAAI